MNLSFAELDLT